MSKCYNRYAVSAKIREEMYQYWLTVRETGGKGAVAKKFNRHASSISRISKTDAWDERYINHRMAIQKAAEKKAAEGEIKNIEVIRTIKTEVARRIRQKMDKDPDFCPTIRNLIELIRLEEEILGTIPGHMAVSVNLAIVVKFLQEMPETRQGEYRRLIAQHWGV